MNNTNETKEFFNPDLKNESIEEPKIYLEQMGKDLLEIEKIRKKILGKIYKIELQKLSDQQKESFNDLMILFNYQIREKININEIKNKLGNFLKLLEFFSNNGNIDIENFKDNI